LASQPPEGGDLHHNTTGSRKLALFCILGPGGPNAREIGFVFFKHILAVNSSELSFSQALDVQGNPAPIGFVLHLDLLGAATPP
jgi:hypothetical protein